MSVKRSRSRRRVSPVRPTKPPKASAILVRAAAPLVVVGLAWLIIDRASGNDDGPASPTLTTVPTTPIDPAAQQLQSQIDQAFAPAATDVVDLLKQQQQWRDGSVAESQLAAAIATSLPHFVSSRDSIGALASQHPSDAVPLYLSASYLYLEWLRSSSLTVTEPQGALRDELDRGTRRLYELAGRVYDQGRALLVGVDTGGNGVEVRLPDPVPDWSGTDLYPRPPFTTSALPQSPNSSTTSASTTTSTTDPASWQAIVDAAGAPSAEDVAVALDHGTAEQRSQLADILVDAEQRLRGGRAPSDEGGSARAVSVRLSWLVSAEALWRSTAADMLATAGSTSTAQALDASATRLALVSDRLWSGAVGLRQTVADTGQLADPNL